MMQAAEIHPSKVNRRLAAVVFADVAGFSSLMAIDDVSTVAVWNKVRHEVMLPYMERHGGRLSETAGDAVLIEFPSAVSAVSWAIEVQQRLQSQRQTSGGSSVIELRVGINVDDVIDDEGILQSDGVNIASRIHQAAKPGEIVLTDAVRGLVKNRLPVSFRDLGTPRLKNIERPVRIFALEPQASASSGSTLQPYLLWSSRPTLAVLPFRIIGGRDADKYFGEGMTEDIITGLSRSRLFFVIARNSMLRFRDSEEDYQSIASILGVKYIVTGSIRRQSNRLRINAELIEVDHSRSVWAERYQGEAEDLFEFQDRIVSSIVASLEPRVRAAETARLGNRPTESLDAYDCVLRAVSKLYQFTKSSFAESEILLDRAVQLDPNYAQAHAYIAWRLNFWIGEGHSLDVDRDRQLASAAARKAISLDPEDALTLSIAGHIVSFIECKPLEGIELMEQALALDENSPLAWALSGLAHAYCGDGNTARQHLQNVWQLTPYDPLNFFFWIAAGIAEFVAERYDEAIAWLRKSARANPRFVASLRMLAASYALSGNLEDARQVTDELMAVEPNFRVSTFVAWYPFQRSEDLKRLEEGLRKAGLPN